MKIEQQHYFRELDGRRMFFAWHQPPPNKSNGFGLLVCDPILEEKQDSRRALVNFSNLAAEQGFGVLRFDYLGQGESDGEFCDFKPDQALTDVGFAYNELKSKGGVDKVAVLGLRYGCNLFAAAANDLDPDIVVFWAPVTNGKPYASQLLRANLASQMVVHRKVIENSKSLVNRMENGETVNIDGYELTIDWYNHIGEDDFVGNVRKCKADMLIMGIDHKPESPSKAWDDFRTELESGSSRIEVTRVEGKTFWKLIPLYAVRPKETFERTFAFLEKYVNG